MLRVGTPTGTVTLSGDRSYVVGRGRDADIVVSGGQVSRHHVSLEPGERGWVVRDVSANGIWFDGRRVPVVSLDPVEPGRADQGTPTVVRLGAADGPRLSLLATWPPTHAPARAPAGPDISAEETMIAAGAGRPAGEPAAGAGSRAGRRGRWARTVPTLLWLMATGFAIGALIALS
jgi:hypothetical protein